MANDARLNNAGKITELYHDRPGPPADGARDWRGQSIAGRPHLNPAAALQDVWWAVLNSNEFILNH